jgi:hypothetical protein
MKRSKFTEEQIIGVLREPARRRRRCAGVMGSAAPRSTPGSRSMVRPRSARALDMMVAMVCINLSGLQVERFMLLAMMGSARPRPV